MIRPANRRVMLDLFPKGGVIAELGVFRGGYSACILDRCQPKRLFLVDLWAARTDWLVDGEVRSVGPEEAYVDACLLESRPGVVIRRQSTIEFLSRQPDQSLDVVYSDADHSYESVRDELALALPRMKPGGWIAGHDYCELFPGVMRAVTEFCKLHKLKIAALTNEKPGMVINCPSGPQAMAYNSYAIKVPTS